jgi:DNA-directed RNA polymerase subunit N (RpoN/RPB10)
MTEQLIMPTTMLHVKHLLPQKCDFFVNNHMYRLEHKRLLTIQDCNKMNRYNQQVPDDIFNYTEADTHVRQENEKILQRCGLHKDCCIDAFISDGRSLIPVSDVKCLTDGRFIGCLEGKRLIKSCILFNKDNVLNVQAVRFCS